MQEINTWNCHLKQGRIYEYFGGGGGGGSGKEFFKGGLGSSKIQDRGNFHTDKPKKNTSEGGLNPLPLLPYIAA